MSKLYKLTKKCHNLVQQLAKQEKIEIEIDNDLSFCPDEDNDFRDNEWSVFNSTVTLNMIENLRKNGFIFNPLPLLEPPQIHQILEAFEGVLGQNPHWRSSASLGVELADAIDDIIVKGNNSKFGMDRFTISNFGKINAMGIGQYPTIAQTLYRKWSDYKTGAFHHGDEGMIEILTELNEILESKIK